MKHNFTIFILSANRAGNIDTIATLNKHGYTGDWYIIIDREEDIEPYEKEYGSEKIIYFDKDEIADEIDRADNQNRRDVNVYARNKVFEIAKEMGYEWFAQFDDDYNYFKSRWDASGEFGSYELDDLDSLFDAMIDYMQQACLDSIATAQGGDFIGGEKAHINNNDGQITAKRKVMNTFICNSSRPFEFIGTINEDVNTYVRKAQLGKLFLTPGIVAVEQERTQQQEGGLTDAYLNSGTYVKSFYTILYSPSSVSLNKMGENDLRIHHHIDWNASIPKIVPEEYKQDT
jgi:hypothetical protein